MLIYMLTNTVNGKRYVGQTMLSLEARLDLHKKAARTAGKRRTSAIARAIYKYGLESFAVAVLEACASLDQLNEAEQRWIQHYDSMSPNGYNLRRGGNAGGLLSDETKERLSKAKKGKKQSREQIEARCRPLRGRKRSPEECAAVSRGLKGIQITWRDKIVASRKAQGYKLSPERKRSLVATGHEALKRLREQGIVSVAGDENPNAKLDWPKVREIRRLWATGDYSQQQLADMFNVK